MAENKKLEEIIVVGYPRSGNAWLASLLGDVLNSPVGLPDGKQSYADYTKDRDGDYIIRQLHLCDPPPEDSLVVYLYRDPRDVAVSVWKYWDMHSLDQAITKMGEGLWPIPHGHGWSNFNERWWDGDLLHYTDAVISYESLYYDCAQSLVMILNFLMLKPVMSISGAVERNSFAVRKKMIEEHPEDLSYNQGLQRKHLRKGIVGDWKNYSNQERVDLTKKYFGRMMEKMGYK